MVVGSLKALDPKRPIREADVTACSADFTFGPKRSLPRGRSTCNDPTRLLNLFGCSAASADAMNRSLCPIFPFNLFCLKLFIFRLAALGPRPQIFGSVNCFGSSPDRSDRFQLRMCVRHTRNHCLPRSRL